MIVDQNTGRIHRERTWRSGLHQAVEVRESLAPTPEKETQARISRQRYCRLYSSLCGLSGTVQGSEDELREFYDLSVVKIPTHRPGRRVLSPSRFFVTDSDKYAAIVDDVRGRIRQGQPVLIGTATIRASHHLSARLSSAGVRHVVLNGLQDASEASIVAQAGRAGAVTVATNMAGRGTDIRLEANAADAGGLHVIAAQFHRSSRVDRQLIGRSARQGDPGSAQFFVSTEDEILSKQGQSLTQIIRQHADGHGECRMDLTQRVRQVQAKLERQDWASRKRMVAHDQWMEAIQSALARGA
jgi:preprotein translocase subunit SecA